jgi:hypothetical protein
MAEQATCPQGPLIQSIRELGNDIHTLKQIRLRYPAFESAYNHLIEQLTSIRDAEFATLGRDAFARLAGSVTNELG